MSASVRFLSGQGEFGLARLSRWITSVSCHLEWHETEEFSISVKWIILTTLGSRCDPGHFLRGIVHQPGSRASHTSDDGLQSLHESLDIQSLHRPTSDASLLPQVSATKSLAADIPKHVLYFGLAGTLPYLGTSVTTVVLAREASRAASGMSRVLLGYGKAHADCLDGI